MAERTRMRQTIDSLMERLSEVGQVLGPQERVEHAELYLAELVAEAGPLRDFAAQAFCQAYRERFLSP